MFRGHPEVAAVSTLLQRVKKSHQKKTKVSRQLFNKMDRDGSGAINHHEFLRYVLVREGKAQWFLQEIVLNVSHVTISS